MSTPLPLSRPATAVVARSLLATAETVGFATFVHTQLGGHLPSLTQTLALASVVLVATLALLSGRVRIWLIAPFVIGLQVALHEGFSWVSGGAATHSGSMAGMPGMPAPADSGTDSRMLFAHLLIGLVAFLVLVCQDQAFAVLAGLVKVLFGTEATALRPLAGGVVAPRINTLRAAMVGTAPRRGPPRSVLLTP